MGKHQLKKGTSEANKMTNQEYATVLRRIADIYAANPNIVQPFAGTTGMKHIFCHSKEDFAAAVKAFGSGAKSDDSECVIFTPDCVAPLKMAIYGFKSSCCHRVVKGEEEVPEEVIPARPATEARVIPAHRREIVEWVCGPFLDSMHDTGGDDAQD